MKEIRFANSPRIGKFNVMHEVLRDDGNRPWLKALAELCTLIDKFPNESGRGTTFVAASELFAPSCEDGKAVAFEDVPQYRIECDKFKPFTAEELARSVEHGGFRFYAVRQNIVRVPPAQLPLAPRVIH